MHNTDAERLESELHELIGADNAISLLEQELNLYLGEAHDECVLEVLGDIITIVHAQGIEYRSRVEELRARCAAKHIP